MNIEKLSIKTDAAIPLMAALPYGVALDRPIEARIEYDPETQLTRFAGRDFCTCRVDESVVELLGSKADTKKDD